MKIIKKIAVMSLLNFLMIVALIFMYTPKVQMINVNPINNPEVCLIVVQGQKYNVIELKKTHSGGNIFNCDTDMTSTFFNQHNNALLNGTMLKYRVN